MSEAATTAIAFLGSFDASLERRWAYSRAVIPGVTRKRTIRQDQSPGYLKFLALYNKGPTYVPQLLGCVDVFREVAVRSGAPPRTLKRRIVALAVH